MDPFELQEIVHEELLDLERATPMVEEQALLRRVVARVAGVELHDVAFVVAGAYRESARRDDAVLAEVRRRAEERGLDLASCKIGDVLTVAEVIEIRERAA